MADNRTHPASQFDWLLDDLVGRVPHVTRAVFLSQDGLSLGSSRELGQADAEHLSALAAGFQSLARGTGQHFGGGDVRQTIVEMASAFFFVSAAGQGTCLAVLTGPEADIGQVAYEMAILVQRISDRMRVSMRTDPALPFRAAPRPGTRDGGGHRIGRRPSARRGPRPPRGPA